MSGSLLAGSAALASLRASNRVGSALCGMHMDAVGQNAAGGSADIVALALPGGQPDGNETRSCLYAQGQRPGPRAGLRRQVGRRSPAGWARADWTALAGRLGAGRLGGARLGSARPGAWTALRRGG